MCFCPTQDEHVKVVHAQPAPSPGVGKVEVTPACVSGLPPGFNLGAPRISVSFLLAHLLFSLMFVGFFSPRLALINKTWPCACSLTSPGPRCAPQTYLRAHAELMKHRRPMALSHGQQRTAFWPARVCSLIWKVIGSHCVFSLTQTGGKKNPNTAPEVSSHPSGSR